MPELKAIIESLMAVFADHAIGAGRNFFRARTVGFFIELAAGVRRLLMVQYAVMIACFVWALAFVGTAYFLCAQYDRDGMIRMEGSATLFLGLGLLVVASTVLYLTIRERTWLKALAIEAMIDHAMAAVPQSQPSAAREELAALVSQLVEAKIHALLQTKPEEVI